MHYKQIKVDFLLNKITKKDSLFKGDYTIDSYQNCEFGCLYCDSSFDKTIYIKTNAAEILNKELEKSKKGTIIVGSVHDPYQKAEEEFKITRDLLKIINQQEFSCHILTKSDLVIRDIDILKKIDNCKVTISITSLKDAVSKIFEKNVPLPKIRLQTIEKLTNEGIISGLAVIPVLPYIVEEELENIVKSAKNHKALYLLHKHLELKGDQKTFFINILKDFYPELVEKYEKLYMDSYMPDQKYILKINNAIKKLCNSYNLKNRI
jgi:DNA repair photolyase